MGLAAVEVCALALHSIAVSVYPLFIHTGGFGAVGKGAWSQGHCCSVWYEILTHAHGMTRSGIVRSGAHADTIVWDGRAAASRESAV